MHEYRIHFYSKQTSTRNITHADSTAFQSVASIILSKQYSTRYTRTEITQLVHLQVETLFMILALVNNAATTVHARFLFVYLFVFAAVFLFLSGISMYISTLYLPTELPGPMLTLSS